MQLQNASTAGYGYSNKLTSNITWTYPFLPGEPPGVTRFKFAACVPSNVTLASICCTSVNGSFVNQTLTNITKFSSEELTKYYESKYPGKNVSSLIGSGVGPGASTSSNIGNYSIVQNAGEEGNIHWCKMNYEPLSSTKLPSNSIGWQSGDYLGNIPESMNNWIKCFNDNVPQNAINNSQAAYACVTDDLKEGGTIQGFNRFSGNTPSSDANRTSKVVYSWLSVMGLMIMIIGYVH
ncbi:uncharacterized protein L201_003163 [Kwoniella dendrophila CBS 6074]|uniref:Uncharacterized protein n=1 Tax=Kwoniella dendrophila CBS 6074 TaxID=1295534 RepID=A0AAX4JS79_9TREE